ncbi:MAG: hypothetical protein RIR11_2660 [Bacteroidota bacterium]|jgi:signal transduction histidine kinase
MQIPTLTIRQRLPLFISISALFILLLVGYFIYDFSVRFCEQEFKHRVEQRLAETDSLIARDRQHPFSVISHLPPSSLPDEHIYYGNDPNQIVLPSGDGPLSQMIDTSQFHRNGLVFTHLGQRDYGIRHDPVTHNTLVVSAIDLDGRNRLQNLKYIIILGILVGVCLLTLVCWFWVKTMLQPIADKIKKARDISAKSLDLRLNVKNDNDELGQLALAFNEMLERIESGFQSQQQFIRNASHEMRTPLTSIIAETDLALQHGRTTENYQQILENIRGKAEDLNELVGQLLLMAKVERMDKFSDQLTCGADEVLMLALRDLQVKYPEDSHRIKLQLEAATASNSFMVRCDPYILQTAFLNLLDNAIKYGNRKSVEVRLFTTNQMVCLEVKDYGDGIEKEELIHLFEPFYRSKQHIDQPGSGIGLSLVKSIMDKYGGNINVQSEVGKGSVLMIKLPVY